MARTQGSLARKALLAGVIALGLTSTTFAQTTTPSTGLGQSWPNAQDVSANPQWHVYVFVLQGIEYVQVNDLNGTVHAAIGTAGGATIVLPVGVDAQNVTTAQGSSLVTSSTVTVYRDRSTTVTAAAQSDGTTQFTVAATSTTATTEEDCGGYNCGGGRVAQ